MAQNDSCILGWPAFWAYFVSSSCTHEMRVEMAKDLRLTEHLENISAAAQVEVLEDAPLSVKQHPSIIKVLKIKAKQELNSGPVVQSSSSYTVPDRDTIRKVMFG